MSPLKPARAIHHRRQSRTLERTHVNISPDHPRRMSRRQDREKALPGSHVQHRSAPRPRRERGVNAASTIDIIPTPITGASCDLR